MIPHNLFDRLFGTKEQSWIDRKKSVLDAVRDDFKDMNAALGKQDQQRLDEHLASVRDLERAIASLPPEYRKVSGAGDRRRREGLSAHRQAAKRSAGARSRVGPDARRDLHADQVPEPGRGCPGWATRRCAITITRTPTRIRLRRSESCATSADGTSRSSPICSAG